MKFSNHSVLSIILIGFLATTIVGCGGSSKKESKAEDVAFSEANKKISGDIFKVIGDLPSPSEVPYTMQSIDAEYNSTLINDLNNIEGYQANEDEAALNLGIFATDIGYLSSYNKAQDALKYMEKCHDLAETLGVATVFDINMMENFQNNLDDPKELNKLMNETILLAQQRLESADRVNVAALVLTGSFVEGLYLATKVVETYPKDLDEDTRNLILRPMIQIILNQKKPLLDVIALLNDLPQDDIIGKMITELNILRLLYDGDLAQIEEKIKENTGDFVVTPAMMIDITTEVKRVRKDIVEL